MPAAPAFSSEKFTVPGIPVLTMKTVLTIAGFDPSSGAGVTADLMVFAAHQLFGTACITALTVQSTLGVQSLHPVSSEVVEATLACLAGDIPPAGVKIGMLFNEDKVLIVSRFIGTINAKHSNSIGESRPVVLDPVIISSSGRELLDRPGLVALRRHLLPLVDWVTPNLAELTLLCGETILDRRNIPYACRMLQKQLKPLRKGTALGIIATGGHLDPPDDFVLTPEGEEVWLPGEHIETRATHGTGCAFSSAFLSRLVLGDSAIEAASAAKRYVSEAMQTAEPRGKGNSGINHLWSLRQF
jgi:hydroxymethylpyrimidine/phosphomethylpyrimidine kinase